jgi:hypothetical protein
MRTNYKIVRFLLDSARNSQLFEVMGGFLYIKEASDGLANIDIQVNNSQADKINLKKQFGIVTDFHTLYISNSAQATKWVDILITDSFEAFRVFEQVASTSVDINENIVEYAMTPTLYNITCTVANTEYSRAILADTKKFTIKARGGSLKVCFTSGQSGTTYILLTDGQGWSEDNLRLTGKTFYFQSPTAGAIAEIIGWV